MGFGAQNYGVAPVSCLLPEQVAAEQWRRLIQDAVLKPEVRRYMFYNSRAFQIAIAVVSTRRGVSQDLQLGLLCPRKERGLG